MVVEAEAVLVALETQVNLLLTLTAVMALQVLLLDLLFQEQVAVVEDIQLDQVIQALLQEQVVEVLVVEVQVVLLQELLIREWMQLTALLILAVVAAEALFLVLLQLITQEMVEVAALESLS